MAPNMITLTGFLFLASSVAIILYYDTTLSADLPRWVYLYTAVTIFAYQALDAIDGKQARITGSASPLGQFFDHLCDAFACTCLSIIGCQLFHLGNSFLSLGFQCAINIIFFLADWEYFHIETYRSGVGNVGVIEAQWTFILCLTASGILGPDIWPEYVSTAIAYMLLFG